VATTTTSQIRVAFVDDDPSVLQALGNVFRRYRREWTMAFFADPRKALEALVADPVDVVVSDARMPQLGGEGLLRELKKRAPGTARVVLSGQSELGEATRLLGVAHQYLSKPCEPAQLAEVVNRVARVRHQLDGELLRSIIAGAEHLPTAPKVWSELSRLLASDRSKLADVVRVIEAEPALVAKVLQVANSAYFGVAQEVASLSRAVMILGFEALRAMVLVFETEKAFPATGVDLDQMRNRSLLAAHIVRSMMPAGPVADATFTAALVADLGAMLLAARVPDRFLPLWQGGASAEAEEASIGVSHPLAGAWLLSLWGVPSTVVDMVALHHCAPVDQSTSSPAAAVWLSLALVEAWEHAPDGPLPEEVDQYVARHALNDAVEKAKGIARRGRPQ
jgi:HD-like signal output (HDOD) protein